MSRWPYEQLVDAKWVVGVIAVAAMTLASAGGTELFHQAQAQTSTPTDRDVLVALHNATGGANWLDNTNWLSDSPLGQWHGVTTGADGRVTTLVLSNNRLSGSIPSALGGLTDLQFLYLYDNQLSGEIPTELGNLANLIVLSLWNNELRGEIPQDFTELTALEGLGFHNNLGLCAPVDEAFQTWLQGVASVHGSSCAPVDSPEDRAVLIEFYKVTYGESWTDNANWLSDRPVREWHGVTNDGNGRVTGLYLGSNQLSGEIPEELGSLPNLQVLDLSDNQLRGEIPEELGSLSNLRVLNLSDNQLSAEIPEELGSLSNLRVLYLSDNQLSAEIPEELGSLSNLQVLNLSDNQLSAEIPEELGSLSNLRVLYLSGNQLTGCVPAGLEDVPDSDFGQLGLPFCEIDCDSGVSVPDPASNPGLVSDCEALLAARGTLAGSATLNWSAGRPIVDWEGITVGGTPQRVTALGLVSRGLTGEIPASLGSLTNLQFLYLYDNQLSGEIPTELGNLANLIVLSLWNNELSGEIPQDFTELTALEGFGFHKNLGLCAPVDEAFQTWLQGVASVHGSSCAPVDSPEDRAVLMEFYKATYGESWTDNANWLSDRPVREWHGVTNDANGRVTGLHLGGNQLSGEIPTELGSLANLIVLLLAHNQLSGEIPVSLGSLTNLQRLGLWNNQLSGEIPEELGSLSNLLLLYLYDNQLSGEIPEELGILSNLQWLNLSNNQLSGEIPEELGSLSNLRLLYLSGNQLTGCVPAGLEDVSDNDFGQLGLLFCGIDCDSGVSVPDPASNPGLVSDCEALLAARDTLAGSATLNWSAGRPIVNWEGITVDGTPQRVTELSLVSRGLTGEIPASLGSLTNLRRLTLSQNQLNGEIPEELGSLTNLEYLYFASNRLTGCVPASLRSVANNDLTGLGLPFCDMLGGSPVMAATGDARAAGPEDCSNGIVVPNPEDNYLLVRACETLLEGKDTLAGDAELNWSADVPVTEWERDVTVTPVMVTAYNSRDGMVTLITGIIIRFDGSGLTGCIPTQTGDRTGPDIDIEADGLEVCTWESSAPVSSQRPYVEGECYNGIVVPNPILRPHVVLACEALLKARETIAGGAELHWSPDIPFREWRRALSVTIVEVEDESGEIRTYYLVDFDGRGLNGCIPKRPDVKSRFVVDIKSDELDVC